MGTVCVMIIGKAEGKTQLGRHRSRWENNIKCAMQVMSTWFDTMS
jgi:hypothetical protein